MHAKNAIDPVIATLVADDARLNMFPKYFKQHYLVGEQTIYSIMRRLCERYNGAYWDFYELSNGGFFIAPSLTDQMTLTSFGFQRDYELSPYAAGIAACLSAYSHLSFDCHSRDEDNEFAELYHQLLEYAGTTKEYNAIRSIID